MQLTCLQRMQQPVSDPQISSVSAAAHHAALAAREAMAGRWGSGTPLLPSCQDAPCCSPCQDQSTTSCPALSRSQPFKGQLFLSFGAVDFPSGCLKLCIPFNLLHSSGLAFQCMLQSQWEGICLWYESGREFSPEIFLARLLYRSRRVNIRWTHNYLGRRRGASASPGGV